MAGQSFGTISIIEFDIPCATQRYTLKSTINSVEKISLFHYWNLPVEIKLDLPLSREKSLKILEKSHTSNIDVFSQ